MAWYDEEKGELLPHGPWIASKYYKDKRTTVGEFLKAALCEQVKEMISFRINC